MSLKSKITRFARSVPPTIHNDIFFGCDSYTITEASELAQIPKSLCGTAH